MDPKVFSGLHRNLVERGQAVSCIAAMALAAALFVLTPSPVLAQSEPQQARPPLAAPQPDTAEPPSTQGAPDVQMPNPGLGEEEEGEEDEQAEGMPFSGEGCPYRGNKLELTV